MVSPTDLNQELYVAFLLVTEIVSSLGLTCLRLLVKKSNKGRVGSYTHVISKRVWLIVEGSSGDYAFVGVLHQQTRAS